MFSFESKEEKNFVVTKYIAVFLLFSQENLHNKIQSAVYACLTCNV